MLVVCLRLELTSRYLLTREGREESVRVNHDLQALRLFTFDLGTPHSHHSFMVTAQ